MRNRYLRRNTYINNCYNKNYYRDDSEATRAEIKDYGKGVLITDICKLALQNDNFRTALWTGEHLQVTLMSIDVGQDIGLELHEDTDQFLVICQGIGTAKMGKEKDNLEFQRNVMPGYAVVIPAGTWHNVINTGNESLKLYSIYAPAHHKAGTVQKSKNEEEK